jgi:hypothetical protein
MHQKPSMKNWYLLVVAFLSSVVMGITAIMYADSAARKSNQQWCDIVTTLDDAYTAQPPQTETGQRIAREMKRMRHDFGCE